MRLYPVTIMGRTLTVMLVGIALVAGILLAQLYWERQALLTDIGGWHVVTRITGVVQKIEKTPAALRSSVLRTYQGPGFRIAWSPQSPLVTSPLRWSKRLIRQALIRQLGTISREDVRIGMGELGGRHTLQSSDRRGRMMHGQEGFARRAIIVSIRLTDGTWLSFTTPLAPRQDVLGLRFFWLGALGLLIVVVVSVVAVRRATAPLQMFARAAERLGTDFNAQPVAETGPREVSRAAKAFNLMQQRLQAFVKNRTQMLAAISHDLRTPITRLKLRAEFMDDDEQRQKMLDDLDEMESMIAATLQFAHDDVIGEPVTNLDFATLVRDCARLDNVNCTLPDELILAGRPLALKRLVNNLLGNALRYATTVNVELFATDDTITLSIFDDGPGIAEDMLERVFEPFVRGEGSRSRETGGVGLGLASVRTIAQAHGGDVVLTNRDSGGLEARLTLPKG